jgi:predicted transcriptional regulator
MKKEENPDTLFIDSYRNSKVLKVLGVEIRVRIMELLQKQELNITEIAQQLNIPQSTATTSILALEKAGLVDSHIANGVKGGQKVCTAKYRDIFIALNPPDLPKDNNVIECEV